VNSANVDISYEEIQLITQAAISSEGTQDGEKKYCKRVPIYPNRLPPLPLPPPQLQIQPQQRVPKNN